jgi:hypothetical protein
MMDFTLKTYLHLLHLIRSEGYQCIPLETLFLSPPPGKFCVLRHDVDRRPKAALRMAELEHNEGFYSTYLFRYQAFMHHLSLIREIAALGHRIGYHYEEVAKCKGNANIARDLFIKNLQEVRKEVPIQTLAMHGSPWSKWDNRVLPGLLDFPALALLGDAYLHLDYQKLFYLTDTGRLWNDRKYNLRDFPPGPHKGSWKQTTDLMKDIRGGKLPGQLMLNTHPGRWNPPGIWWVWEKYGQAGKNLVKAALKTRRRK